MKSQESQDPTRRQCQTRLASGLWFIVGDSLSLVFSKPLPNGSIASSFISLLILSYLGLGVQIFAQTTGEAEVALQGYYLGGSGQPLLNTSGMAIRSTQVIEGVGLLGVSAEGYGSDGFHTGNTYVGLKGAPIFGWHWDFVGVDFQFSSNMVENPFLNIYTPEIGARGFRMAMRRRDRSYEFFVGEETLLGGPRIPFRILLPQRVLGAAIKQKVGNHWEFGVRFLNLSTGSDALTDFSNFFYPGHDYKSANSLTAQSIYSLNKHLKFYAEGTYGTASSFPPSAVPSQGGSGRQQAVPVQAVPFSVLVGPVWETEKLSLRADYVRQSTTYLPLLGYFVGDRKGPYAEGHYRPVRWADLYASASGYSNNLENNPQMPTFRSTAYTSGASLILPWKFNIGASLSTLGYTERDPLHPGEFVSHNRQLTLNVARPVKRHSLRLSYIDMKLNSNIQPQNQRFLELADNFVWKRFVVGGAVREQNSQATENRNSLFFRGSLQANFKRLSAYGYIEKGSDLVNKSIFSTNSYSSTVAGMTAPLVRGWNVQVEAYRNKLLTDLNPENIFLFGNGGLGLNTQLAAFNQWSVFVRISKQFHWGRELPGGFSLEGYAADHAPLVGSVQGLVMEQSLAGPRPAANVAVALDRSRTVLTDANGRYDFLDVPEGPHEVAVDLEQLPTDYEPGTDVKVHVTVEPRALERADFNVVRLTSLAGRVAAPAGVLVEGVVVRLAGTDRYTTPDADGSFAFYNLREGEYDVAIDDNSLPEGFMLVSAPSVHILVANGRQGPTVVFAN